VASFNPREAYTHAKVQLSCGLLMGVLLLAAPPASQAQTPPSGQTVVLRGARVVDGTGGNPIDNGAIVIRDGRIVAVGPSAGTAVPAGAEVIDYSGKTIIPGLISAHAHVGIFAGLVSAPDNYNRDFIQRQLRQLEAYGVTTVMSLGLNGPLFYDLRAESRAGRLPGADLFGATEASVWSAASRRRRLSALRTIRSRGPTARRRRVRQ
jgi:hypothetical protein